MLLLWNYMRKMHIKQVNKHIMYYHIDLISFDKIKQGKKRSMRHYGETREDPLCRTDREELPKKLTFE